MSNPSHQPQWVSPAAVQSIVTRAMLNAYAHKETPEPVFRRLMEQSVKAIDKDVLTMEQQAIVMFRQEEQQEQADNAPHQRLHGLIAGREFDPLRNPDDERDKLWEDRQRELHSDDPAYRYF